MVEKEYTESVKEIYREIEIVYKDTNETEIETVSTRRFQTRGGKKERNKQMSHTRLIFLRVTNFFSSSLASNYYSCFYFLQILKERLSERMNKSVVREFRICVCVCV